MTTYAEIIGPNMDEPEPHHCCSCLRHIDQDEAESLTASLRFLSAILPVRGNAAEFYFGRRPPQDTHLTHLGEAVDRLETAGHDVARLNTLWNDLEAVAGELDEYVVPACEDPGQCRDCTK